MLRIARLLMSLGLLALASSLSGVAPASAASARIVSATVVCNPSGSNGQPDVEITLVNHSRATLSVGFARGFTTPKTFTVRMIQVDPGKASATTVAANATKKITAVWDNLRNGQDDRGGALIVTNLGILTPICGDRLGAVLSLGAAPKTAAAAKKASAEIAAKSLGQLEAWRVYPALYALLHPDARAEVSFNAVACWYAGQYGTADAPASQGVLSTNVTGVSFGDWTWAVTGKHYANAAAVTATQKIGDASASQTAASTEHLVSADGQWRWFFGVSKDEIAAQATDCNLGNGTVQPVATQTPDSGSSTGTGTIPDTGSIMLTTYTCPDGMTLETLDASACALDPAAVSWTLAGSTLAQPLPWSAAKEEHGPGFSWDGLGFGEYIITPDALPNGVTEYAITGSDNANRQDAGIALTLGASEPNISLSIYLFPSAGNVQNGMGSIEVDFFDCQPGMTPASFNAADCSPMPAGFSNFTLTPGPDVDASMLPGGPIFTITDETDLGNGAFQIGGLPVGTYEISPGQNYSGPLFYAPAGSPVGSSGPGASTYEVTLSAAHPNAALAIYRLGQGIG